ncbi:FtsK/SpoIIIE domain-containing protein [Streptomyces cinnamoneus]
MSTELTPYEGEYVWGEFVEDDASGAGAPDPADEPATHRRPSRMSQKVTTAARAVAGLTGPGYANLWHVAVHMISGGHKSDDEFRRALVKIQLDQYQQQRTEAQTGLTEAEKRLADLMSTAATTGLNQDQKIAVHQARDEVRRRQTGLTALRAQPFEPVQPTADQITRARSVSGAKRFVFAAVAVTAAGVAVVIQAPLAALAALPVSAVGAWWLTRHPIPLTQREIPEALRLPELGPGVTATVPGQAPDPTAVHDTYDPSKVSDEAVEFTRALYAIKLLKPVKVGEGDHAQTLFPHATIEGPAVRDELGWSAVMVLPSGMDLDAEAVMKKRVKVAAEMSVDESLLILERVPPSAGGHARMIRVSKFVVDPFTVTRLSPLIGRTEPLDLWGVGAPVAFGPRGDVVFIPLRDIALLLGGASRSGKGVAIAALICAAALDPRVRFRIIDGKGSGEHNRSARLAATFFKHSPERLLALLLIYKEEMDRRHGRLSDLGRSKLDADLLHEMPIEVVVVDELYPYTTHKKLGAKILRLLILLGSQGLDVGIILVMATQTPMVEVVPRLLRNNVGGRWGMRTDDGISSNTILGDGRAGQGFDASKISDETRGVGWLALGGIPRKVRSCYTTDAEFAAIMAVGYALRQAAGTLPGQRFDPIEEALLQLTGISTAAGGAGGYGNAEGGTYTAAQDDDPEDGFDPYAADGAGDDDEAPEVTIANMREIVALILSLYPDDADRAHLADIADRVNANGTHGNDWDAVAVGDALRNAGVTVKPVRVNKVPGKGVFFSELHAVLGDAAA